MKIQQIIDKIDDRQLFIPSFQREFVWKRNDAKSLIDSLIKGYPTGTILTWETSHPPHLRGGHEYSSQQGSIKLLLDGQQRITSLYMLIKGEIPYYYASSEIQQDPRNLYVNIETLELSYYHAPMKNNPRWCSITDIFKKSTHAKVIEDKLIELGELLDHDGFVKINDNINKIFNIVDGVFPEQIIPPTATIRDAIDIFYKVNASGVSLTDAELALAQISGYWPEARDKFKKKIAQLEKRGVLLKLDHIIYILLGCMDFKVSDISRLHDEINKERIIEVWTNLESHLLDHTFNFLQSNAYVDHTSEVNSIYVVVPLIAFFYQRKGLVMSTEQKNRIVRWFYYSQLRNRYVYQVWQNLDFDLRIVRNSERPFEELLAVIAKENRLEIIPNEFIGRRKMHPLYSLMKLYQKSQGACCLVTGWRLHKSMEAKYELEDHRIFTYGQLKKYGFDLQNRDKYSLAQELTNRVFLFQSEQHSKPILHSLKIAKDNQPEELEKLCIPTDVSLWDYENYEKFLNARRKLLAKRLNDYLNGFAISDDVAGETTLIEQISNGESDELEFKSSLRWDYKLGTKNKDLEFMVVKAIAAFANSFGGTLLIGVDDEGDVLGLENDYHSLSGDKDKFQRHLLQILNRELKEAFVAHGVSITFPNVNGIEICQINVSTSNKPLFLEVPDSKGVRTEKFYIRNGNLSQQLAMSEFHKFWEQKE